MESNPLLALSPHRSMATKKNIDYGEAMAIEDDSPWTVAKGRRGNRGRGTTPTPKIKFVESFLTPPEQERLTKKYLDGTPQQLYYESQDQNNCAIHALNNAAQATIINQLKMNIYAEYMVRLGISMRTRTAVFRRSLLKDQRSGPCGGRQGGPQPVEAVKRERGPEALRRDGQLHDRGDGVHVQA